MKIRLRYELPSPELDLVANSFSSEHEVLLSPPWDVRSYTEVADVVFCLGPVSSCPLARHRVLIVLGQTKYHPDMDWDLVLVTSDKARRLALAKFGHGTKVVKIDLPLYGTELGSKMIVEPNDYYFNASECHHLTGELNFALWANLDNSNRRLFCTRTFNGMVRGGAVGDYSEMEDGYDIQVRRHLALGGKVFCNRDEEVLGDLADVCFDSLTGIKGKPGPGKQDCVGDVWGFSLIDYMEIL